MKDERSKIPRRLRRDATAAIWGDHAADVTDDTKRQQSEALKTLLGWNEAMAVLFNPLYFTALLCAIVTGCEYFHQPQISHLLDVVPQVDDP